MKNDQPHYINTCEVIIWSISSIPLVMMRNNSPQCWQELGEKDISVDGVIGLTFQEETLTICSHRLT